MKLVKYIALMMVCISFVSNVYGQKGKLTVTVDKDVVAYNENIKVVFLLENLVGNYTPPNFEGFKVISGPNTSSSFSMINGDVTQKKSYTYIIRPDTKGDIEIGAASVEQEGNIIATDPILITVIEDAQSIAADKKSSKKSLTYESDMSSSTPNDTKPNTKKRVLKKI